MTKHRVSNREIIEEIDAIRNINREVGFATLAARENLVLQRMNALASMVGATAWDIRAAVLSARSSHEVAAELEALICVH